jgi:hypothetical protein
MNHQNNRGCPVEEELTLFPQKGEDQRREEDRKTG